MLTLHKVNEEESLIHLGQCLLRNIRGDQRVSHTPTCYGSFSNRKTFPAICSSDWSLLRSFISPKQWWKPL